MKKVVIQGTGKNSSKNSYEIADPSAVLRNLHSGILRGDEFKRFFLFPEINTSFL